MRRSRLSLPLVAAVFLTTSSAFGSGYSIFEQGAKATAMGGAFAATADDPSAIFYNVAGIAQQRRAAFLIGGTAITFGNEFRGDPNDAFSSGATGFSQKTGRPARMPRLISSGWEPVAVAMTMASTPAPSRSGTDPATSAANRRPTSCARSRCAI